MPDDPSAGTTYAVTNTLDGSVETAWSHQGSETSNGVGEWLVYRFDRPYALASITLVNGYGKTEDLYLANSRASLLRITTDAGSQIVEVDPGEDAFRQPQVLTGAWGTTSSVTIEVLGVTAGSRHPDLLVSEVTFTGS